MSNYTMRDALAPSRSIRGHFHEYMAPMNLLLQVKIRESRGEIDSAERQNKKGARRRQLAGEVLIHTNAEYLNNICLPNTYKCICSLAGDT